MNNTGALRDVLERLDARLRNMQEQDNTTSSETQLAGGDTPSPRSQEYFPPKKPHRFKFKRNINFTKNNYSTIAVDSVDTDGGAHSRNNNF